MATDDGCPEASPSTEAPLTQSPPRASCNHLVSAGTTRPTPSARQFQPPQLGMDVNLELKVSSEAIQLSIQTVCQVL